MSWSEFMLAASQKFSSLTFWSFGIERIDFLYSAAEGLGF